MAFFVLGGSADNDVLASDLLKKANATSSILATLVDKGIFESYQKRVSRLKEYKALTDVSTINLTEKQQEAYEEIHKGFEEEKPVLLHGVTASGKTEIYIKLIQEAIDEGKQVLYLLPEIALTEQIINRLKKYFGDRVGVYHSRYDNNERVEIWQQVMNFRSQQTTDNGQQLLGDSATRRLGDSKYQIIIGSRSAVFLPFTDLGLIIVDEEHDSSFKQIDPAPRYSARDLAVLMSKMFHARLLMGSATPSFESYYNARQKEQNYLHERFDANKLQINYQQIGTYISKIKDDIDRALFLDNKGLFIPHKEKYDDDVDKLEETYRVKAPLDMFYVRKSKTDELPLEQYVQILQSEC